MHEMGLLKSMLKTADSAIEGNLKDNEKIKKIVIEVGELTGAVPAYLQNAYGPLTEGTVYEGSSLEIIPVPGTVACKACGREFEARKHDFKCPDCGGVDLRFVKGKDIIIREIVVE